MLCRKCVKEVELGRSVCGSCQALLDNDIQTNNNSLLKIDSPQHLMFSYVTTAISLVIYILSVIGFFFFPLISFESGNLEKVRSFADLCVGNEFKIFIELLKVSVNGGSSSTNVQFITSLTFICFVCIAISIIMMLVAVIKFFLKDIRFSCRMIIYWIIKTCLDINI